jgi:hypothetical protein
MTSNASLARNTLISSIHAQHGPPQGPGRGVPTRVGDRSGTRAALFAAVGEPPPVPSRSGHRCQARSADRSRNPVDAGRAAAGQPGRRDRGTGRRGDQRARSTGRLAGRAGPAGRQRVGAEHHRAHGGRHVGAGVPGNRAEPDRPSPGRSATDTATRRDRRGHRLPIRRRSRRGRGIPPPAHRRRPDLPHQPATRRQPRESSPLRLDRRLRTVPGGAARRVRARRLHPPYRLAQRRHGRRAIPGRRRPRRRHPARPCAPSPPPTRRPHLRTHQLPPPHLAQATTPTASTEIATSASSTASPATKSRRTTRRDTR